MALPTSRADRNLEHMVSVHKRWRGVAEMAGRDVSATPAPSAEASSPDAAVAAQPEVGASPSRRMRLEVAAAARGVPLATILVTVAVVVAVYLLGRLAYALRDVLLWMVIAGFLAALVLNPFVLLLQKHLPRRGYAVALVVAVATIGFLGLLAAFGYPLSNGWRTSLTSCRRTSPTPSTGAARSGGS